MNEIENLTLENMINLEYKFIFDYYDKPLSFIGCVNQTNYLFYFINDNSYFVAKLTKKDVEVLSELKNFKNFLSYLIKEMKLNVLTIDFKNKLINCSSIDDSLSADYLPETKELIQFDFNEKIEIAKDYKFENKLTFATE